MLTKPRGKRDVSKRVFLSKFKKNNTYFGELGEFMRRHSPYRLDILQRLVLSNRPLKLYELYRGDSYEKNRIKKHIPTMSQVGLIVRKKVNGLNIISLTFNGLMVYLSSLNVLIDDFLKSKLEVSATSRKNPQDLNKVRLDVLSKIGRISLNTKNKENEEVLSALKELVLFCLDINSEVRFLKALSEAAREITINGFNLVDIADHVVTYHDSILPEDLVASWEELKARDDLGLRGISLIRTARHLPYDYEHLMSTGSNDFQRSLTEYFMRLFALRALLLEKMEYESDNSTILLEPEVDQLSSIYTIYTCLGCEWLYVVLPSRRLYRYVVDVVARFPNLRKSSYIPCHLGLVSLAVNEKPQGLKKLALISYLINQLPKPVGEEMKNLLEEILEKENFKKYRIL